MMIEQQNNPENSLREFQENVLKKTIQNSKWDWLASNGSRFQNQLFNMRVWSWLRMNAGGVLNTCKSNEAYTKDSFGMTNIWLSGGRVSNAWVTYLI